VLNPIICNNALTVALPDYLEILKASPEQMQIMAAGNDHWPIIDAAFPTFAH
jgi:hypothetical protein